MGSRQKVYSCPSCRKSKYVQHHYKGNVHDSKHFSCLPDSFMSPLSDCLHNSILAVHHARQPSSNTVMPSATCIAITSSRFSLITVLVSSSFFQNLTNISLLSSTRCQLLRVPHGFVHSCVIWSVFGFSFPRFAHFPWESTYFLLLLDARMRGAGLFLVL